MEFGMQATKNLQQGYCMPELLNGDRHVGIYVFLIKEGMKRPVPEMLIQQLYCLKMHVLIRYIH